MKVIHRIHGWETEVDGKQLIETSDGERWKLENIICPFEGTDELSFLEWLYSVIGDEDEDYMGVISRRIDRIKSKNKDQECKKDEPNNIEDEIKEELHKDYDVVPRKEVKG